MVKPPRDGSLAAKIYHLRPGESVLLPDRRVDAGATNMERQVQSVFHRHPALVGRKFTTTRRDVIIGKCLAPYLEIRRCSKEHNP